MAAAKTGDTVKVHYTGKLKDDTVFDSSRDGDPLEFAIGGGQLIPDFEQAVIGMNPGETKTVDITAERAYGPHHEQLVFVIARTDLPDDIEPQIDQRFQMQSQDGRDMVVTVTAASESDVTFDANHPLAGKDLIFDIELVSVA